MTTLELLGFDTETRRIGMCQQAPPLVCLSLAAYVEAGKMDGDVAGIADVDQLEQLVEMVMSSRYTKIGHNTAYDLAVLAAWRPSLIPRIFQMLENGEVRCTKIREKLINLCTHGSLDYAPTPGGGSRKLSFSLADVLLKHTNIDIKSKKAKTGIDGVVTEGESDSWRLNFQALEDMPAQSWPAEAREYAIEDSIYALEIHQSQEEERARIIASTNIDPFVVQNFRVMLDFSLFLMSCWGMAIDPQAKAEIEAMLAQELRPERLNLLVEKGILRPAEPPRLNKKGSKKHVDGCKKKWKDASGDPVVCDCPVMMTAGVDETINETVLREYIVAFAKANPDVEVRFSDPSTKFPAGQVSTAVDFFEQYMGRDKVFEQYHHRAKLQKLVTTEIPRMNWHGETAAVVHPQYDVLKETGRISSHASDTLPSFNCQNLHPTVRQCYVPREGFLLFSCDISQMELVTLAQRCLQLFGKSVLADKINAGVDVHAFLAGQIAFAASKEFHDSCTEQRATDTEAIYQAFKALKGHDVEEVAEFFKHYRKLAKPTGLGYPGGLGPETFITYAKATFGVDVTIEQATMLREVWKLTLTEMPDYFKYINEQCIDPYNPPKITIDKEGKEKLSNYFAYTSPFGMYRAGCGYCAAANGLGMQTPGAEGFLLGVINVVRACFDHTLGSILRDDDNGVATRPICAIHDEILGEVRDDELAHERVYEVANIMVQAMRIVTPDVAVKAQPVLMRRWDKAAEPVFDANQRLIPWEPPTK